VDAAEELVRYPQGDGVRREGDDQAKQATHGGSLRNEKAGPPLPPESAPRLIGPYCMRRSSGRFRKIIGM
jgi:hypothetical protein